MAKSISISVTYAQAILKLKIWVDRNRCS